MSKYTSLNLSGKLARYFVDSKLTVMIMIAIGFIGIFALLKTAREENPQITVPAANVFVEYPGASAREVEEHISKPLEALYWEIPGVEEVYSVSRDSLSIVTLKFYVGEDKEESLIKLYDKVMSNIHKKPEGALDPVIRPIDVDDVPIVAVTLYSDKLPMHEIRLVADDLLDYLRRIPGTANPHIIGGQKRQINVLLDPERLAAYKLSPVNIARMIQMSNANLPVGDFERDTIRYFVETGDFLRTAEDVGNVVVSNFKGQTILLKDIAGIEDGATEVVHKTRIGFGPASKNGPSEKEYNAVTVALAKKKGLNAVKIADSILQKVETLKGNVIPESIKVEITRNDGKKADHAVNELVFHLAISIVIVVALLALSLGTREAAIVALAIPLTLFLTLGIGMIVGQTINRITLFALILSLGLLVDDAIVVVENIHRHYQQHMKDRFTSAVAAVNEIGSPTALATFTVIISFVPLAFVTGMMGPYMRPIPFNVPIAMFISLLVAFIVTPWASARLLKAEHGETKPITETRLYRTYRSTVMPFLKSDTKRKTLYLFVSLLILFVLSFPLLQWVQFRMLPKADKNTFLITIDMPNGTALHRTDELALEIGKFLRKEKEVKNYQTFAGTASVIDFNGLLKGSFFRNEEDLADIRVNLIDKDSRKIDSETIVKEMRPKLQAIAKKYNANLKLQEDPPGPPVRATVLAEIYGPDYTKQRELAKKVRDVFAKTEGVTDIDDSVTALVNKYYFKVDKEKAMLSGISTEDIVNNLYMGIEGKVVSTLHVTDAKMPVGIQLRFEKSARSQPEDINKLYINTPQGVAVPLSTLVKMLPGEVSKPIYHKNLEPVVYVYGEMEGRGVTYAVIDMIRHFRKNPLDEGYRIVWDGEWDLQWDVMYDLGMAMVVSVVIIYLILVGRFHSFTIPLTIMGAIPLAMIGIMPGFALVGIFLSATSMIGIITLSGIVVRNSIVLLEFMLDKEGEGVPIEEAIVEAGAVRFRPIVLTALAAILGSMVIVTDPVWSGLAWTLIFGMTASTALTLVIIPIFFYSVYHKKWESA